MNFKNFLLIMSLIIISACKPQMTSEGADIKNAPIEKSIDIESPNGDEIDLDEANQKAMECMCNRMYMPVCSADGKRTYSNSCEADCVGEKNFTLGACEAKE